MKSSERDLRELAFSTKSKILETVDSPNSLEQDKEHLESVIKTIFNWDKTDNQIIVASIEGKDVASAIANVNIIVLDNEKNHLLNKEDYVLYEEEISEIFMKF